MKREEHINVQLFKIKLYLLAMGILILAILLVRNKSKDEIIPDEGNQQTEKQEQINENVPKPMMPTYNGTIRVLLKTNAFTDEYHEQVKLFSDCEMQVCGQDEKEYTKGTELNFVWEKDALCVNGELLTEVPECFVVKLSEGQVGTMSLATIQRNHGIPSYEGSLEIWPIEAGFVIVNEVPLETYLNYVVPSEMPAGFQKEALKAQAVCARTYACKHLKTYAYPEYQAHVDDSVRFQVYNNTGTAESTTEAVTDTQGLILTYQKQPITAYYYSTSCGYTGDEELWWEGNAELTPYLQGKTVNASGEILEMNKEEVFADFIRQEDETCYDYDISWYRWETKIDVETLSAHLNEALKGRYAANPEAILTKQEEEFQSISIESIGKIQGIEILERNSGGAAQKICVRGSEETIIAETEYNVRALLNVKGETIVRKDGSLVEGGTILPSAYFTIAPTWDEEGELKGFSFRGGGYGHGAGMSQNGANVMAKQGKKFEEILQFFYTDVELEHIRESMFEGML